ncbi:elongation factor P hydroxylase [Kangiella marina]|uniref:Elongation factor P hydroxylase n=1 Tax=Kangiella marina TaxID=1079178 RepID=A0ABP8ID46_9GAMM
MLFEPNPPSFNKVAAERCVQQLAQAFNRHFSDHRVVLKPGANEPFYQAPKSVESVATIYSTHDYFSSALHEVAHWCIAGVERRNRDDYGYWYEPDGRNAELQALFFKVEVKPQALEWAFSLAAGIPFRVSLDNLDAGDSAVKEAKVFREQVHQQLQHYFTVGFPQRAARMIQLLCQLYRSSQPINLPKRESCLL